MNFSEKIRDIRKKQGLSQEQLAEKIGVSRQAITKWETGKGLPDMENMIIMSEIFKTTIDELIFSDIPHKEDAEVYQSETVYDIDRENHFDINLGGANAVTLSSGTDEKLHICLKSDKISDIGSMFKIKLNGKKNKLDIECINKNKISRFEAENALNVDIKLPEKFADHCELAASVRYLDIDGLNIGRLEYDGDAAQIMISNSSGSLEFTAKTDYDVTVDSIKGSLDFYQFNAKAVVHIRQQNCPKPINKGRKCKIYFLQDGEAAEPEFENDTENVLSVSGIGSELIVDLIYENKTI